MPITDAQFAAGLEAISLAYPNLQRLTDAQRDLWFSQLCDLEPDEWQRAVATAIREGDDWPTIAKLRKYGRGGLDVEDRAALAFGEMRAAARSVGGQSSVEFADPVIAATIRSVYGGWCELCDLSSREVDRSQGSFERTYARLCRSGITRQQAGPFLGWLDRDAGRCASVRKIGTIQPAHEGLRISGPEPKRIEVSVEAVEKLSAVLAITDDLKARKAESEEQRKAEIEAITAEENENKRAAIEKLKQATGAA